MKLTEQYVWSKNDIKGVSFDTWLNLRHPKENRPFTFEFQNINVTFYELNIRIQVLWWFFGENVELQVSVYLQGIALKIQH